MRHLLSVFLLLCAVLPMNAADQKLNFVFVLIDDMGLTDLGCYGSKFYETPHLDRLAKDGLKFTNGYSACTVCSPTRAAFLTGKYPARTHVTDWIAGHVRPGAKLKVPDWTKELRAEETSLAELLKGAGYATASIGKWHLGDAAPTEHGFDLNVGGTNRGQPPSYFAPYKIPTLTDGPDGEFLSDRLTSEAERFVEANRDRPFFLYLPHFAVHTPIAGKPEVIAKYAAKSKPGEPHRNATYAALVESVDDSIGRLRAKLEALGIAERTVFVFTSDNGGLLGGPTTNLGIRAGKGSAYEGGVRVPLIVWWPGTVRPGESAVPVMTQDWFATFCDLAGVKAPGAIDGASLAAVLRGKGELAARPLFWHYPHYHPGGATPYSAIRAGDLRLVHFYEDDHVELYDLKADPAETTDLAAGQPGKAKELRRQLDDWRAAVGAQAPTANPAYDPTKAAGAGRKKNAQR